MANFTTKYTPNKKLKFSHYSFNGKNYKTKLMLDRAMSKWLKNSSKRTKQTPIAKPVYKILK